MSVYDIAAYGAMIADRRRLDAYREALLRHVTPETTVLDLGTGTGICALLACRLGAAHVYAVEPEQIVQTARQIARDNGLEGKITFIEESSMATELPARVDLLVSDLRGVLPFFGLHIPSIVDARARFLAPGGALVPRRDVLWVSVIEAPQIYETVVGPWSDDGAGIDMRAARSLATQTVHCKRVGRDQLLAEPACWGELDYRRVTDPDAAANIPLQITRAGTVHGLVLWFDAELADGVTLSNAPGEPELVYGTAFLPLTDPLEVETGDRVAIELRADLLGDDYVWSWNTSLEQPASGQPPIRFRQSTFHGVPVTPDSLRRGAVGHAPRLTTDGRVDLEVLAMIDGSATIGSIADRLVADYPDRFPSRHDALARVIAVTRRRAR